MLLVGRVGKAFGKTPLQQALEYGRITSTFLASLSPDQKILIDHHILNRLIEADNDAQEKATKEAEEKRKNPGVKRMVSVEERSEQLRQMRKGNKGEEN